MGCKGYAQRRASEFGSLELEIGDLNCVRAPSSGGTGELRECVIFRGVGFKRGHSEVNDHCGTSNGFPNNTSDMLGVQAD